MSTTDELQRLFTSYGNAMYRNDPDAAEKIAAKFSAALAQQPAAAKVSQAAMVRLSRALGSPPAVEAEAGETVEDALVRMAAERIEQQSAASGEPVAHAHVYTDSSSFDYNQDMRRVRVVFRDPEWQYHQKDGATIALYIAQPAPATPTELERAHNAGFVEASRILGAEIQQLRAAQPAPARVPLIAARLAEELQDRMCGDCKPSHSGASCCMPGARAVLEEAKAAGITPAQGEPK